MSGPQRAVLSRIWVCAIVTMNLGWRGPLAHPTAGAQPPKPSAEDTKKRIEEERKRIAAELEQINQPEVRRERQLLDDLNSAIERHYWRKEAGAQVECESRLTKILALPAPSAKAYSTCATVA